MKQLASLAWKEWRESQTYLWIGMGVLLGLPAVGGLERSFHSTRSFQVEATPWVLAFGSLLSVFAALGATCRDLNSRTEEFWRSQPIGMVRWLLIKYLIGFAVVVTACTVPLVVEAYLNHHIDFVEMVIWSLFLWMVPYSVAFLTGCVARRTAHAAMLALTALLVIYAIPIVLPPLRWIQDSGITTTTTVFYLFAGLGVGFSLIVLLMALICVRRGWRIESGQKLMYGAIAVSLLLLLLSASFQVGTNLPILQQIDLPEGERVQSIVCDGASYFVTTEQAKGYRKHPDSRSFGVSLITRSLELSKTGIRLGARILDNRATWRASRAQSGLRVGQFIYNVGHFFEENNSSVLTEKLFILNLAGGWKHELHLWKGSDRNSAEPELCVWQNRLYVIGSHLMVLDITEPRRPRVVSDQIADFSETRIWQPDGRKLAIIWRPIAGLPPRERLNACIKRYRTWEAELLRGDSLYVWAGERATRYHLATLTDHGADFEEVGTYVPTVLEMLLRGDSFVAGPLYENRGLLYLCTGGPADAPVNSAISVVDTAGKPPMRNVGHFSAPGLSTMCLLPDGRAVIGGGNKLWLVGPPPRRAGN